MRYSIYLIIILYLHFFGISIALSDDNHKTYNFDNISNVGGWNWTGALETEENGFALKILPNAEKNILVKNIAPSDGAISFNYSIPGNFNYYCKLNFSIDGVGYYLSPHEKEGMSDHYSVKYKSTEHIISWNFTCPNCPLDCSSAENGPRCIIDDVDFINIEIASVKSLQEIPLDPFDKDLNDIINNSSNKVIKLNRGVHMGPIFIGASAKNITIEPVTDPQTNKYVDVIIDGNYSNQAIKLTDTNDITLNKVSLRGAVKALILNNSSNCVISNLDILNFNEDGIYVLNCKKQANRIEFNKISSKDNGTLPFNIENSNDTIFFGNEIEIPDKVFHYYLDNSYNNKIYISNSCNICPILSNKIKCVLTTYYDFDGKYPNASDSEDAKDILGNWLTR
jgi:hypothetical protein